jgi:hypothetical protein
MRIELFGNQELNELFIYLRNSQKTGVILNAYKRSAKPMLQAIRASAKTNLKKRSGNLFSSFGIVPLQSKMGVKVGARKFGSYKGFHAHFFDEGTKVRQNSSGANRGQVKATNYFSSAVRATADSVSNNFAKELDNSFTKFILMFNSKNKRKEIIQ